MIRTKYFLEIFGENHWMWTFKSVYSSSVAYLQLSKKLYRKAFISPPVCNVCPLWKCSKCCNFGDTGHRDASLLSNIMELDCSQLVVLKALESKSHMDGQYHQPILALKDISVSAFMLSSFFLDHNAETDALGNLELSCFLYFFHYVEDKADMI